MSAESTVPNGFLAKTFYPTWHEFKDFKKYVAHIEKLCNVECIAKVVPPKEFHQLMGSKSVADSFVLETVVTQIRDKIAARPSSAFNLNFETQEKMTYAEYVKMAMEIEAPFKNMTIAKIEDRYWEHADEVTKGTSKFVPKYAIDNEISLFPDTCPIWNLNKFSAKESLIHGLKGKPMEGINTPYLYVGMIFASFAWHIEDGDLCSVNYNHDGKAKLWYSVPKSEHEKLEKLAKRLAKKLKVKCSLYLRHKCLLIPPSLLKKHNILFTRVIQEPGEFVISLSGGYHSGFNLGLNQAEAVNFGTPRWLKFFSDFKTCDCGYNVGPLQIQERLKPICDRFKNMPPERKEAKSTKIKSNAPPKVTFSCDNCTKIFTQKRNLLLHKRQYHDQYLTKYKCPICVSKLGRSYDLKNHFENIHGMHKSLAEMDKYALKIRKTKKVKAELKIKNEMKGNIKRKAIGCHLCGKIVHGRFNLNRHLRLLHPSSESPTNWKKKMTKKWKSNAE